MSTKSSFALFPCAPSIISAFHLSIIPCPKCHGFGTGLARVENLQNLDSIALSRRHDLEHPRRGAPAGRPKITRSEEHTSELQSPCNLVCRLLLEKKKERKWSDAS